MEIIYYVAASLDGFIATPDGGPEFYASVDAVVLGPKTYQQCLGFPQWPYPGKRCWIFSRSLSDMTEAAVRFTRERQTRRRVPRRRADHRIHRIGDPGLA
jgi:dihydrofolate reductase